MSYATLLKPRPEILAGDGVEGIIDIANLKPRATGRKRLENDPTLFFELTYPTADIKRVVENLHRRFNQSGDSAGLFLFEGLKGSGKSHLLLLVYHLLKSRPEANLWLKKHDLTCEVPDSCTLILNKFTDQSFELVWEPIYQTLTGKPAPKRNTQPSLSEIEAIVGERRLVLIFDELEQGIRAILDPALRVQNLAFLQMISEWANRSPQLTLFASIYSDDQEPGATLKRVPRISVQFANAADKSRVVLHRLFENYLDFKPRASEPTIRSYVQHWAKNCLRMPEDHVDKFKQSFPFTPELIDLLLYKVPARGGFQGVRGALGFLAQMVRLSYQSADAIMAAHANLNDQEIQSRLLDLDPTQELVARGNRNLTELKDTPLADEIASAVMLATLAEAPNMRGIGRDELIRNVLRPGDDINDFEQTLARFQKYASHFHQREGRFYFDLEENAEAKVEYEALKYGDEIARQLLYDIWQQEVFREKNSSVIYRDRDNTQAALRELDSKRLRYVLSPRRLSAQERFELYFGLDVRNQVILLEPREAKFDLAHHPDLLKWAKRLKAAQDLTASASDTARRSGYERIERLDRKNIIEHIKKAGVIYVLWNDYGADAKASLSEEEPLDGDGSREKVLSTLREKIFPQQVYTEHLQGRIHEAIGKTVAEIDAEYRKTLTFPVPTLSDNIAKSLRELCRLGIIGIYHSHGQFCHENPQLSETEMMEARVGEPFDKASIMSPPSGKGETVVTPPERDFRPIPPASLQSAPAIVLPSHVTQKTEHLRILPQDSLGQLRQELAGKLLPYANGRVLQATFTVWCDHDAGDLASLPAPYRGNFSGKGRLTVEINLTKEGQFSKAEVEHMAESLPVITGGRYSATIDLLLQLEKSDE